MPLLDHSVATFAAVAAVVTLSPGSDTMLVIRNTVAAGKTAGLITTAGIICGGSVHAVAATVGLSALLLSSSQIYMVVRLVGALYLAYLGVLSIRNALKPKLETINETSPPPKTHSLFAQGFLTNALNPKVAFFYVALLPQFIHPGDPVVSKTLLLIGTHYCMGALWLGLLSLLVSSIRNIVAAPRFKKSMDLAAGSIFILLGARIALDRSLTK